MNVITDPVLPVIASAVLAAILCVRAAAQNPTAQNATDPAVQALLAKIDAARGGPVAGGLSLAIEGTYAVTFKKDAGDELAAKGAFREFYVGADFARHTSDLGEYGAMERGITKDLVWEVDPSMGAKVHRGANAAVVRRYFAFLRGASPKELYKEFVGTGTQPIDGREHTALRMTPAEGKPDVWYVDADGVVTRIDTSLPAPESADAAWGLGDTMDAQITFADWRVIGGVRHAHRRALHMGSATVSFVCTKIEVQAKIDVATRFTPPDAVAKVKLEPVMAAFGPDGKPSYQIVERQAQPVATIRVKCKPTEISATLAVLLPEVGAHLHAIGANVAGAPFSRYHAMSDTEIDIEAGFPVHKPITAKGRVGNSELPAGRVVTAWHIGPYEKLTGAHEALQAHLIGKKEKARGGVWEIYWTDPGMVADPTKWRTQLFAPIE